MKIQEDDAILLLPFLAIGGAASGGLNALAERIWYDPSIYWSTAAGFAGTALAFWGLTHRFNLPVTIAGLIAVLGSWAGYTDPSEESCATAKASFVHLLDRQNETVQYWRVCSSPSPDATDYCFDFEPDFSPTQMEEARERKRWYLAKYCSGTEL